MGFGGESACQIVQVARGTTSPGRDSTVAPNHGEADQAPARSHGGMEGAMRTASKPVALHPIRSRPESMTRCVPHAPRRVVSTIVGAR